MSSERVSRVLVRSPSGTLSFHCPGCKRSHTVRVEGDRPGPVWGFDGNLEAPTFTPSILVRSGHFIEGKAPGGCWCDWPDREEFPDLTCGVCHSFVRGGRIEFLSDCTHELAGQTVDLPAYPD